jgi:hypothetical protein
MSEDYFSFNDRRTAPKAAYRRPMPVQHRSPAPDPEPEAAMHVEENRDPSDSVILKVGRAIRDRLLGQ